MTRTLEQLNAQGTAFQIRLNALKKANPSSESPWYLYDSIGNFALLAKFLGEERRDVLKLMGGGPVLDLCCADGDLSFFVESLGCTVHAVDWPRTNMNFMRGIRRMKESLNSNIEIYERDLDGRFELPAQFYSTAFFFGGLYHLKNPFYVLEELAKHVYWCFLSTRVARFLPDGATRVQHFPVAYLVRPEELNGDHTNYWIFSESGLKRILHRAGWGVCDFTTFGNSVDSDPVRPDGDERAYCLLRSRVLTGDLRVALLDGWHKLEEEAWCWTARRFNLRITNLPASSVRLVFPFVLPDPVFKTAGPVTVRCKANGSALPAQTFYAPGKWEFVAPLNGLSDELVLEFDVSAALAPDDADQRERALIVAPSALSTILTA